MMRAPTQQQVRELLSPTRTRTIYQLADDWGVSALVLFLIAEAAMGDGA